MKKNIIAIVLAVIMVLGLVACGTDNANDATVAFNGNPVTDKLSRYNLSNLADEVLKGIANDMCDAIVADTSGDHFKADIIPGNFRELMYACKDNEELLFHVTEKAHEAFTSAASKVELYSELNAWVIIPEVRILSEYFAHDFKYDEPMALPYALGLLDIMEFYPEAECKEPFHKVFNNRHYSDSVDLYIRLAKIKEVNGLDVHARAFSRLENLSKTNFTNELEKCSNDLFYYMTHANHSTLLKGLSAEEQEIIRNNILNNWHFDFYNKYWYFLTSYTPDIVDEAYASLLEDAQLIQEISNEELKSELNADIYSLARSMWEGDKVFPLLKIIGYI